MRLRLIAPSAALAQAAADHGAGILREAIRLHGHATLVAATGMSQLALLEALAAAPGIAWSRVTVFHLDEYIGIAATHPASFRRYLRERFLQRLPEPAAFVPIQGDAPDLPGELQRLNQLLEGRRVDLCFAGVGDNAHLAFNEPPADFETPTPFIQVHLQAASRRQQAGQGWFAHADQVPDLAISMSVRQILRSAQLLLTVTGAHKATAVRAMVEGPVDPQCPASSVQGHGACTVYLDGAAASGLSAPPQTERAVSPDAL